MSLVSLREAIRAKVADKVKPLAQALTHGGRFDPESVTLYATKAPCALVGILGVRDLTTQGRQLCGTVLPAVFVLTKDGGQVKRDTLALAVVQSALTVIRPGESWGDTDASGAEGIRADNLFHGKLVDAGVALWGITWRQPYDFVELTAADLADFLTFDAKWNLGGAGTPQAEDIVTLPR